MVDALAILQAATVLFMNEPSVCDITVPKDGRCFVVGDLHGQLVRSNPEPKRVSPSCYFFRRAHLTPSPPPLYPQDDLLHIFRKLGMPSSDNIFIFNGDLVDRGDHSCEIVLLIRAQAPLSRRRLCQPRQPRGAPHQHLRRLRGGVRRQVRSRRIPGVPRRLLVAPLCVRGERSSTRASRRLARGRDGWRVARAQSRPRTGRVQRGGELGQGGLDSRHAVERSAPGPRVSRDGAERARCGGALGRGRDDCFFGAGESLGHCSLASVRAQRRRYPARRARLHGVQRE